MSWSRKDRGAPEIVRRFRRELLNSVPDPPCIRDAAGKPGRCPHIEQCRATSAICRTFRFYVEHAEGTPAHPIDYAAPRKPKVVAGYWVYDRKRGETFEY